MTSENRATGNRLAAGTKARAAWHQKEEGRLTHVAPEVLASADAVIARTEASFRIQGGLDQDPDEWLSHVGSAVKKLTVKQHIIRIELAYALWKKAQINPKIHDALVRTLPFRREKPTVRTEILHLAVESVITYGDDTLQGKRDARKLYNRDVQAIRHLDRKNVLPSHVEALARKKGQGLNQWARGGQSRECSEAKKLDLPTEHGRGSAIAFESENRSTGSAKASVRRNDNTRKIRKVGSSSRSLDVIEWKSGGELIQMLHMPATPQAKALVDKAFSILRMVAAQMAPKTSSAAVESQHVRAFSAAIDATANLMKGLGLSDDNRGRGLVPVKQLSAFDTLTNSFLAGLEKLVSEQPMDKSQIEKQRRRIHSLRPGAPRKATNSKRSLRSSTAVDYK